MRKHILLSAAAAVGLCLAAPAMASIAVQSYSGGTQFASFSGIATNDTVGFTFSTSADLLVTALGWNAPNFGIDNGLLDNSHRVGIWTSSGTLLTQGVVTAGAPDATGYRYVGITPLLLSSGQQFYIGGTDNSVDNDSYVNNVANLVMGPNVTFLGSAVAAGGFAFPAMVNNTSTGGRFGPNVQYTVQTPGPTNVPEPAAWALMIGGFVFAGVALRSGRARAA